MQKPLVLVLFVWAAMLSLGAKEPEPSVLYLTWQHDPTSTMMIHWHSQKQEKSEVAYRCLGDNAWETQEAISVRLPRSPVWVHTVELMDLQANTDYEFRLQQSVYCFRTLPVDLARPVRFVVGGDAYLYLKSFRKMNAQIAAQNPDFVIVGGDIAYTCGVPWLSNSKKALQRWEVFLSEWKETLVTREGRLIPLLPVVGNHDVRALSLKASRSNHLFYDLFAFPKKGIAFRVIDVGNYLSLFLLDTGHSCHVGGLQAQWLKKVLADRENKAYKVAAYHVAGYPSYYPYDGAIPKQIREEWSPVFERYHLSAAFEHHNHAYKRTYPMKAGRVDVDGIVYLGDGSWGVSARETQNRWYLLERKKINAVCVVTLSKNAAEIEALRVDGEKIDSITLEPTHTYTAFEEKKLLER